MFTLEICSIEVWAVYLPKNYSTEVREVCLLKKYVL